MIWLSLAEPQKAEAWDWNLKQWLREEDDEKERKILRERERARRNKKNEREKTGKSGKWGGFIKPTDSHAHASL